MIPYPVPEIMRISLSESSLHVSQLRVHTLETLIYLSQLKSLWPERDPGEVLRLALDAPPEESIVSASNHLKTLGAIDFDGSLTPLGTLNYEVSIC